MKKTPSPWLTILGALILAAAISCAPAGNGDDNGGDQLWLIGEVNGWSLTSPLAFTATGNGVYVWQGFLPSGDLHFNGDRTPAYSGTWYGPETDGESIAGGETPVQMYLSNYSWNIGIAGTYIIRADVPAMKVSFNDNAGGPPVIPPGIDPGNPGSKGQYGNYYEIFVGSFYDSNNDGMGDLKGVIQKLDYLNDGNPNSNTSLHIDGIWFMPINPSPSYHKYDVTDYKAIDPRYGTMQDFEDLIAACNSRGIRVIIDLVVNHTSTGHNWFVQARNGNATYQAYYNIANNKVNNNYYSLGSTGKWYEAVFWDQMPDLNYDNPAVKTEMQSIVDFWIAKGVAGFRLDAVKHVYDNQAKNIEWLRWFTDYCKSKKADVYIVGEVWDSESTIQNYYTGGITSNFNFPAAQNYIPTYVRNAPARNFAQFVVNWNVTIKTKNSAAIDAPFLTNHDIDRFATTIGTDSTRLKMAAAMLLFMPGNPFIYYGEELGMTGDLPKDENVRGPMIWSKTSNTGKTNGPPGNDKPYWNVSGVAEQLGDANSILRFYIDALKLKNRYPAIHWGSPSMITTTAENSISAYRINTGADEKDLAVVHNLSGSGQTVTISGASVIGGTLSASGAAAAKPTLSGNSLTMPAYTTAVIEY
jgi:glycosidase